MSEKDFSHFETQHSKDAKAFSILSNVAGTQAQSYQYFHSNSSEGINYYRLRMVDQDGTFAYSRIVSVTNGEPSAVAGSIYPNPASGKNAFIDFSVREPGTWQVSIYNVSGVLLGSTEVKLKAGLCKIQIDVSGLPAGIHLIRFQDESQHELIRKIAIER